MAKEKKIRTIWNFFLILDPEIVRLGALSLSSTSFWEHFHVFFYTSFHHFCRGNNQRPSLSPKKKKYSLIVGTILSWPSFLESVTKMRGKKSCHQKKKSKERRRNFTFAVSKGMRSWQRQGGEESSRQLSKRKEEEDGGGGGKAAQVSSSFLHQNQSEKWVEREREREQLIQPNSLHSKFITILT